MKYSYSKDIKSTFQDAENKVREELIKIVFPFAKNLLEITDNNNILKLSEEVDLLLKKAFSNIE